MSYCLFEPVLLLARRHPGVRGPVLHHRRRPHRPGRTQRRRQEHAAAADRRRVPRPTAGSVTVDGTLGYLPQTLPLVGDLTVAEVLGVAPVIDALDAVESPATSGEDVLHRDRRRLGHRGAHPRPAGPARPRRHRPSTGGWARSRRPGRLARPGRAAAQAARRAAARRADQQPRPRRPAQALRRARRLDRLPAAGQPRPGAARPDGPHRRARIAAKCGSTAATSPSTRRPCSADAGGRREERPQRRAGAQAGEAGAAAGPRTGRAPGEQRRPQPEGRRPAEDLRGNDEAQRAGVGGPVRRDARRPGRTRRRPGSTRPSAPCATTTRSRWNCPTPTCPPGAPSFGASACRSVAVAGSSSPTTAST